MLTECPKRDGGLGVCSLEVQNRGLLLKLLHRLHQLQQSAWAVWFWREFQGCEDKRALLTAVWHPVSQLSPPVQYRDVTTVELGDGRKTPFWSDYGAVADRFG